MYEYFSKQKGYIYSSVCDRFCNIFGGGGGERRIQIKVSTLRTFFGHGDAEMKFEYGLIN